MLLMSQMIVIIGSIVIIVIITITNILITNIIVTTTTTVTPRPLVTPSTPLAPSHASRRRCAQSRSTRGPPRWRP